MRSPEKIAADEAERAKREREAERLAEVIAAWREQPFGQWRPIETCPFEALDHEYGVDGAIWVTDGDSVALATVTRRFGRPVRIVTEPEMVITDSGVGYVGGRMEEIEAPEWWFAWELQDRFDATIEYGETVNCEVNFIATHWMLARPMPPVS